MRKIPLGLPLMFSAVFGACLTALVPVSRAAASRPNIVFILADDIGYADLSCYGATVVQTPNLDRLARDGRRFTDAHSAASTCSPSRRALLTGAYSWRQAPGSAIMAGDAPLSIRPGTTTLPSLLKRVGYTTGVVGKWHLGLGQDGGPNWNSEVTPGPLEVGFDYAFYFPATGDRVPSVFIENRRVVALDPADPITVSYKAKVGGEPTGRENPDQLVLKATHGHDGTIVNGIGRIGWMTGGKAARFKDEDIADTFTQKAIRFIEGQKGGPFFLYLATHDIHVPRVPHPRYRGKSQSGTRGDAVAELDGTVGAVLAALDRLKLADNTLVIFSSDNGGVMDDGYEDVGRFDYACNGILHGGKGTVWEGGHRVPFIARWPGHIQAGGECAELITQIDILATVAALVGETLPADAGPDSMNVLPALLGSPHAQPAREAFIAHTGGTRGPFAIRQGAWKLITGGRDGVQLFDLASDLEEKNNLREQHPEIVARLTALFDTTKQQGRSRP